jgi:hypothetical protein
MSLVTKIIGATFLLVLFFGAIVLDILNWPTLVYGIPVIGLEVVFFISLMRDLILDTVNSY